MRAAHGDHGRLYFTLNSDDDDDDDDDGLRGVRCADGGYNGTQHCGAQAHAHVSMKARLVRPLSAADGNSSDAQQPMTVTMTPAQSRLHVHGWVSPVRLAAGLSRSAWPNARLWSFSCCLRILLLLGALFRPAVAAQVAFENCLPDSYKNYEPTPLQWRAVSVDASFDTTDTKHTLRITMWGNVTGSSTNVTLPPPSSPDWTDATKLDGKILDEPEPDAVNPKLTTLHSKIDVLTYEPWNESTNFCKMLANASCPLAPVFNANSSLLPIGLPYLTISNDFYSSYAFTSFSATFLIIYGDAKVTNIGCVSAAITPDLGNLTWMLKFLPLLVLLFVAGATVFAGIFSPWGTVDIFHWTSNYGRDPDLLRLVTPGFGDCLQYIQFIVLTGGLTLNYPGFYQPIVSQASWSTLMFNQSFVSKSTGWLSLRDGIYVTNGTYGLQNLAQLVGMGNLEDIWAGMMVWLLVIIASMFVLVQSGFLVQWVHRFVNRIPEEDLRAKNIPFTLGNVVRIVLNYFLLPIVALSAFQLVVSNEPPAYSVALAVVTLVLIIGFAAWLLYLVLSTKPRAVLFDDLPTVLLYGPLYNTYSDEAVAFTLIPVFLTFIRGITIGAVQPAGVAQVIILAVCEVVQILTLHGFRPFHSPTSMNAYHTLFSALRLVTVLLMVAFVPSLGVTEGPKGWIGYAILLIHGGVLVLGFFLNAVQTIVEVAARMLGAGGDDVRGQSRGGLSKIFGMRQLSRRMSRREAGPSRQSQLSSSAMLDAEDASKAGYIMAGGRIRSESAGSMGILMNRQQRSSSALDNVSLEAPARNFDSGASSLTPTTPGEASMFSFLPSPGQQSRQQGALGMQTADPYYRPPRQRRPTLEQSSSTASKTGGSWITGDWSQKRLSQAGGGAIGGQVSDDGQAARDATSTPHVQPAVPFAPRTDYSTREVDFYYGVRGQRLNSVGPNRKLGTGPADPTGPMASAAGWFRNVLGGKGKEKAKGFEVVRSARMPPAMRSKGGDFVDEVPEGIPVAMGVLRNGPIESDDEDEGQHIQRSRPTESEAAEAVGEVNVRGLDDVGSSETRQATPWLSVGSQPAVPRKSSKRPPSVSLVSPGPQLSPSTTTISRLPFERTHSQERLSGSSTGATEDFSHNDPQEPTNRSPDEQTTSYGFVQHGSIDRVHHDADLLGSSAEVVDETR